MLLGEKSQTDCLEYEVIYSSAVQVEEMAVSLALPIFTYLWPRGITSSLEFILHVFLIIRLSAEVGAN